MPAKKSTGEIPLQEPLPQRLYRSSTDRMLGGVAGGIGEFFRIDSTLIRLFFVLTTVFGGMGVLLYLIMWLIIPAENSLHPNPFTVHENLSEMRSKAHGFTQSLRNQSATRNNRTLWSILLIGIGLFLLVKSFAQFNIDFSRLWPLLFIVLGLALIFRHR